MDPRAKVTIGHQLVTIASRVSAWRPSILFLLFDALFCLFGVLALIAFVR